MKPEHVPLTEESLAALLCAFTVTPDEDLSSERFVGWGKGEAKGYKDLFKEIRAGESHLVVDASGLRRVLRVVRMDISDDTLGTLLHTKTILPDGRVRNLNRQPSGKIAEGEHPIDAVGRELKEELGLLPGQLRQLNSKTVVFEEKPSKSYPGLRCVYEVHPFDIVLHDIVSAAHATGFVTKEPNGQVLHFSWQKNFTPTAKV